MSTPGSGGRAYRGSAPFYRRGRLPYPSALPRLLANALALDGTGRLLDVGCGPGTLTLDLAEYYDGAVGIDADRAMIMEARAVASMRGVSNTHFTQLAAEALPDGLGRFRTVLFAQSFHWLNQHQVAAALLHLLEPGGSCAVVYGWTLRGEETEVSPYPLPPYQELNELVHRFRGSRRPVTVIPGEETEAMVSVGLQGPTTITVPGGELLTASVDDLIARYLSRSDTSADSLGDTLPQFQAEVTALLTATTSTGRFTEQLRSALINVWKKPSPYSPDPRR